ncbi:hypothetical protein FIBSPDRAFT_290818 [Athelia psychrophila]|uniref:Uncharacterized protein n=1 Tax=Athelia psychrophila TaxID=1759441 RepID=A0A167XGL0_9AGAM|nr:hypothetical protein FIBSPDRAFT_290818 [Fibularhizoctonia sp. CBS 109695]
MPTESLNLSPRASSPHRLPRSANATPRPLHQDPYTQNPTRPSRLRPQPSFSSNSAHVSQTYAQASKARLYLRHMASAPSIKPAPHSSLNTSLQRHSSSRYATRGNKRSMTLDDDVLHTGRRGNGEGEEDPSAAPPLPRTWLESVAHAVLFGGTGTHMGGPSAISPSASSRSPSQSNSQSRSPISRSRLDVLRQSPFSSTSALSDRTNVPRQIKGHPPPLLCVTCAGSGVVCHSAPGS